MSDDLKRLQREMEARDQALADELVKMRETLKRESRATRRALRQMCRSQLRQTADLDQSLATMTETLDTHRTNASKIWSAIFTVTARHETSIEDLDRRLTNVEHKLAG